MNQWWNWSKLKFKLCNKSLVIRMLLIFLIKAKLYMKKERVMMRWGITWFLRLLLEENSLISLPCRVGSQSHSLDISSMSLCKVLITVTPMESLTEILNQKISCWIIHTLSKLQISDLQPQLKEETVAEHLIQNLVLSITWLLKSIWNKLIVESLLISLLVLLLLLLWLPSIHHSLLLNLQIHFTDVWLLIEQTFSGKRIVRTRLRVIISLVKNSRILSKACFNLIQPIDLQQLRFWPMIGLKVQQCPKRR